MGLDRTTLALDGPNRTNGGIAVAEVIGSSVVSVAEHVMMTILIFVHNFIPAYDQFYDGDWGVAVAVKNDDDLENMVVGTVAVVRIGERVLQRLKCL